LNRKQVLVSRLPAVRILLLVVMFCRLPGILGAQQVVNSTRVDEGLRISADGRRIIHADGAPFFWLGDTAWELLHRLTREEADVYLRDRAQKGYSVIQTVVLAERDGLRTPNAYGDVPLLDHDPTRPNGAYFEHVDYVVRRADSLGLYVGMLPTWGDKFNKQWGIGPEVFTPQNAQVYGRFLGRRYRDAPIIWILGGDRNPEDDEDLAIIRAMATGLRQGAGGTHLITYHPQGGGASFQWFHDDDWLDLNLFQSGHGTVDNRNYERTAEGYALEPAKPVIDGEPRYEDHPVNWNPENGWFDAFDVRQAAYWSVLAGAAGHTYGNHNVWQMLAPGRDPISSARTPWREALGHPGAAQMGFMRRLFLSRPFLDLIADQATLVDEPSDGPAHVRAARGRDGSYLFVYTPTGRPVTVDLTFLSDTTGRAWWFDPRTGTAMEIGTFARTAEQLFDPPGEEARGNDWVLVIDAASRMYPPPGSPHLWLGRDLVLSGARLAVGRSDTDAADGRLASGGGTHAAAAF
jgi:hypothetical protein